MRNWPIEAIKQIRNWTNPPVTLMLEDFLAIATMLDAFHQDKLPAGVNPYHCLMVSGKHTQGFMNVSTVVAYPNICEIVVAQMLKRAKLKWGNVDVVVGPGNAAITISYEAARQLGARHGFTEKDEKGLPTKFGGRTQVEPGERVLIVNELMSTVDGSTLQCKQGVLKHQPQAEILPSALVLFNRSGCHELTDGTWVISEFNCPMPAYTPDACPCCNAGSQAIKVKVTRENWLMWKNAGKKE